MNLKLKQITDEILFSADDFGRQFSACHALYDFFVELTGISHSSENADDSLQTILANGKAIAPKEAAHCVLDFARTTQFLRGIYAAIIELKKRFPSEKLEILYAGCGPFATLIIPLMSQFEPNDFRVTLIDFHKCSIDAARKIVAELEFDEFIADFLNTDANAYKHSRKPHLIICETMQTALKKEPQVALTRNLAPQLAERGIFVPQKISVAACLANSSDNAKKERIYLGEILALNAENVSFNFPTITLEIPPIDLKGLDFMLLTKVSIFDKFVLNDYDSGITYPQILHTLRDVKSGNQIEFTYISDKNPRFEFQVVESQTSVR